MYKLSTENILTTPQINHLWLLIEHHLLIAVICNGVDVRWIVGLTTVFVHFAVLKCKNCFKMISARSILIRVTIYYIKSQVLLICLTSEPANFPSTATACSCSQHLTEKATMHCVSTATLYPPLIMWHHTIKFQII
jgi:hypothetical protein